MRMLRIFIVCPAIAFLIACLATGPTSAAVGCQNKAKAAQSRPMAESDYFDLAEGSSRGCAENCVIQCREAQRTCSGDAASCRAQFQICARRCVVSCDASK
jgi:hypothetical protein